MVAILFNRAQQTFRVLDQPPIRGPASLRRLQLNSEATLKDT